MKLPVKNSDTKAGNYSRPAFKRSGCCVKARRLALCGIRSPNTTPADEGLIAVKEDCTLAFALSLYRETKRYSCDLPRRDARHCDGCRQMAMQLITEDRWETLTRSLS